ncbi:MAG: hypothetical protein IJH76_01325 [Clostridia bacterium]|nr:hypothetical protein [Clostridia bacterium]
MKILAPISSLKEVEKVINAGADEVYCGIIDKKLTEKYSLPFINRRPFDNCNLSSFNELKGVVDYCHKRNGSSLIFRIYDIINISMYYKRYFYYV